MTIKIVFEKVKLQTITTKQAHIELIAEIT